MSDLHCATLAPIPLRLRRKILGMSAILLPLTDSDHVDWIGFRNHVLRTLSADLVPAVNMDTGYAHLISESVRIEVLKVTQELCDGKMFVAGAFVSDRPGNALNWDGYRCALDAIQGHGGTPVIFQSFGLTEMNNQGMLRVYENIGRHVDSFIGFELGRMFAPFGRIYDAEFYEQWIQIPQCIAAKHSSLSRQMEWDRLEIRDRVRPEFRVLTGNDLAIDMVMYGSDYLLGLSTFDPGSFALRDRFWETGDPRFYELNDWLQYLGMFVFRPPVPAYKHNAAQYLHIKHQIASNRTYPNSATRPESDIEVLRAIAQHLDAFH
jgi:dihydrodipicolinate synthase/N-acetylneuraminate lyase